MKSSRRTFSQTSEQFKYQNGSSDHRYLSKGTKTVGSQSSELNGLSRRRYKRPYDCKRHYCDSFWFTGDISAKVAYSVPLVLAFVLYLNTLPAGFVYDDHRAIVNNPDVIGVTPLSSIWSHDFWGAPIQRRGSHGSWRPLTILSFRLNALWTEGLRRKENYEEMSILQVCPGASFYFHAVNILLHIMVTGAYVCLLEEIGIHRRICLWAGSLFAAHPVHVEAVSGVVGRAELLGALAFCLAIGAYIFYIRGRPCGMALQEPCLPLKHVEYKCGDGSHDTQFRNSLWLYASVLCAAVGVMCKEQAVTSLGVGIVLHCALVVCTTPRRKNLVLATLQETWLSCALATSVVWWRTSISPSNPSFTPTDNPAAHIPSPVGKTLTVLRYWVEHARLILLPNVLSFDWSMGAVPKVTSLFTPVNFPGFLLLAVVMGLSVKTFQKLLQIRPCVNINLSKDACHDVLNNNYSVDVPFEKENSCLISFQRRLMPVIFSLALLIIPFLPASNLWAWVGFVAAERVLYLPSMGASLLIAQGADLLITWLSKADISYGKSKSAANHRKIERRRTMRFLVGTFWAILVFLMSARTIRRNWDWYSDETLYRSGINVCPAKAFANLGVVYSDEGRLADAEDAYKKALSYAPQMADTHYNLGLLLSKTNRLEEAKLSYEAALRYRPWFAQTYLSLALVLNRLGDTASATKILERCLDHSNAPAKDGSSHAWALTNCRQRLARNRIIDSRPYDAIDELQKAFSTAPPGFPLHNLLTLLAEAYVSAGDHSEAQEALDKALKQYPAHIPAHLAFSRLLIANGSRAAEAEDWIRKAVTLAPDDAHVLKHLGQLLLEEGRAEEAIEPWVRAVHLDPSDHTAAFNAATALRLAGKHQHAETFYRKAVTISPEDVSSQRNLGAILHLNGKLEEALQYYKAALHLAPNDPQTMTNLQRLTALLKKKETL